jgi:hypothetical protein
MAAVMTIDVQFQADLDAKLQQIFKEFETKAAQAISEETDVIETEFKQRIRQQIALPVAEIDKGVRVEKRGTQARIIASGDPVPLSRYPHRKSKDGVQVQINPGQFIDIKHARIRGDDIIFFQRGGAARTLYGPSVEQIARTEFDELARQAEQDLARTLNR